MLFSVYLKWVVWFRKLIFKNPIMEFGVNREGYSGSSLFSLSGEQTKKSLLLWRHFALHGQAIDFGHGLSNVFFRRWWRCRETEQLLPVFLRITVDCLGSQQPDTL